MIGGSLSYSLCGSKVPCGVLVEKYQEIHRRETYVDHVCPVVREHQHLECMGNGGLIYFVEGLGHVYTQGHHQVGGSCGR